MFILLFSFIDNSGCYFHGESRIWNRRYNHLEEFNNGQAFVVQSNEGTALQIAYFLEPTVSSAVIELKLLNNIESHSLQIKTTAPDKFRVRRSTGTLSPGQSTNVTVTLQTGYNLRTLLQNKFLVMCVPVKDPQMTTEQLTEFWKVMDLVVAEIMNRNFLCARTHWVSETRKSKRIFG